MNVQLREMGFCEDAEIKLLLQQGNVIFSQKSATAVIVAPNTLGGFSGNIILASAQLLGINGGTVDSTNGSNIQIQVSD